MGYGPQGSSATALTRKKFGRRPKEDTASKERRVAQLCQQPEEVSVAAGRS